MDHLLHRLPPPYRSARALAGLLSGFLATAMSPAAQAQSEAAMQRTPVFVWGFQEGCKFKSDTTAQVMDRLAKEHAYRVEPLLSVSGQALPVCPGNVATSGLGCSAALQHDCSAGPGLVLGGVIDHRDKATRIRLWLYDLQTRKLAVQDDYCQQCDPDDSKVVASQAAALLQAPAYQDGQAAQPSYCQRAPVSLLAAVSGAGPLHLGVFGSGSARDEIRKELLRRIGLKRGTQQQPAPTVTDQRGTDPASFESVTRGQEGAQVLRIELSASSADLYLWDQRSRRVATRSVSCADSCRDALESIAQAAAELLDICFADRCSLVQPIELRPADACADLSKQECPALPMSYDVASGRRGIDRGLAQRIEILTGVGLGLSAAVTAGMWVANATVTVDRNDNGTSVKIDHPLQEAAGVVTGLTGGLVGLSIPIFYYLEKAKRVPPVVPDMTKVSAPASLIRCPISSAGAAAGLRRRSRL